MQYYFFSTPTYMHWDIPISLICVLDLADATLLKAAGKEQ